ncbi:MAG: hypothetical protein Q8S55_00315 [Methylococcaceae bacterium]|nr:hypothetical protein [Methylococcaceae bacterium]
MNNTIKLAVASALLAAASSANAGIMIPAGDWTLDIGGVVNAYYTSTRESGNLAGGSSPLGLTNDTGTKTASNITTGLLPNYLSVSGKTRQNDLDVGFTISIQPGASQTGPLAGGSQENRQAFLTFGDASWGSIKLGKDLGIFASDAILSDMTLLGVGSGAGALAGGTTTLGRIGTGYIYADWKSQVAYSSPNWNGFSFTAGVTQAWNSDTSIGRGGNEPAFEAKASYAWAGDFAGKVWVSGISQQVEGIASTTAVGGRTNERADAFDIGANVNVAGFGLTGYYYTGEGIGQTIQFNQGFDATGKARDSDGYYVQGTYTLPGVGTKLGLSWGESNLDANGVADAAAETKDTMWTLGAYHPLTKHLNLVAEYSDVNREVDTGAAKTEGKAKTVSLGAILFF